ncbi:hypothetical protein GCM10017673_46330 [Streptosporangium violaceochromogenes]|nr:hypothetical protein GCM10017673_46330 [Streptosporangium violaceochromogenes]
MKRLTRLGLTAPCIALTAAGLAAVAVAELLGVWVLIGVAVAAAWAAGACWDRESTCDRCHASMEERTVAGTEHGEAR